MTRLALTDQELLGLALCKALPQHVASCVWNPLSLLNPPLQTAFELARRIEDAFNCPAFLQALVWLRRRRRLLRIKFPLSSFLSNRFRPLPPLAEPSRSSQEGALTKKQQKHPAGTFTGQRFQRNRAPRHNNKGVLSTKTMPRKVSQKCLCDNPSRDFVSKREDFAQDACSRHVHPTPTQLSRSCAQRT